MKAHHEPHGNSRGTGWIGGLQTNIVATIGVGRRQDLRGRGGEVALQDVTEWCR